MSTSGSFNYLAESVAPSIYRNGKVLIRRDLDGSDGGSEGVNLEAHQMPVLNARHLDDSAQCTLARNGFELVQRPLAKMDLDFFNHQQVVRDYYPQCAQIVAEACGASMVRAFDHNVRSASGKHRMRQIEGGQQVQGPVQVVHGDYTLTSAPQRLRDLGKPPGANDTLYSVLAQGDTLLDADEVEQLLAGGRYAIINLWRNIDQAPVESDPLALCDATSVGPQDLVVLEIHYHDRIGENYLARYADGHQWYYYPALTRDEALLIKQWDSLGSFARSNGAMADTSNPDAPCTFSFHSAFEDPSVTPEAAERQSIEVRCIVFYD